MKVRVCDNYKGSFGVLDPEKGSVALKTNKSPVFEVGDDVAKRHIREGVLEAVYVSNDGARATGWAEIKEKAKRYGIKTIGVKKEEILRQIEEAEKEEAGERAVETGAMQEMEELEEIEEAERFDAYMPE